MSSFSPVCRPPRTAGRPPWTWGPSGSGTRAGSSSSRSIRAKNREVWLKIRSTEARFMVEIRLLSLPQPPLSCGGRWRDLGRGRDRRRNRWVAGTRVVAKKSAVEVFSALKNPQLALRKRERCISGRTDHNLHSCLLNAKISLKILPFLSFLYIPWHFWGNYFKKFFTSVASSIYGKKVSNISTLIFGKTQHVQSRLISSKSAV